MSGYALRLEIKTCSWADVPFHIRAGNCLPSTTTQGIVHPKRPPLANFDDARTIGSNYLRCPLSPQVVTGEHGWHDLTPEVSAPC